MIRGKENVVSVWLGGWEDSAAFWTYMEVRYTEDGDAIPSQFAQDFGLDFYEIEFQEAEHLEEEVAVGQFVSRASYSSSYIEDVVQRAEEQGLNPINCGVLIFDFEVKPDVKAVGGLTFIGVFDYSKDAPMLAEMQ